MGSQLRIAIALAALRHKPPAQSIEGSQFPEPWRERALALESELENLRSQHDQENIELLALRKGAQPRTRAPRHTPADDGRETDSTPSTTAKKAKSKKTKLSSAVATPPAPASSPAPPRTPAPGTKSVLSAILQGDIVDSQILRSGPFTRISSALDAADALVELLAADSMAASVDLILSTTLRTFNAIQAVFSRIVAHHGSAHESAGTCSNAGLAPHTTWDPALTLGTLVALVGSLISTVIPALLEQRNISGRRANNDAVSLKRARAARAATAATTTAIDDILGGVYELVLIPAVRALAQFSEGYLVSCFADTSASLGERALDDAPVAVPDLRPDVFALLEGVLAILDDVLPGNAPLSTSASSPAGTAAAVPAAIPGSGSDQVRTLLALECVRELDRLYNPHLENTPQAVPDAPSDSPAQAYPRPPLAAVRTPASLAASSSGTHAARAGTAPAALPYSRCGPPRAARDLGETERGAASGPAQHSGPVRDSPRAGAASASGGKAKGGRRGAQMGERIVKLARKDAVWWLCAVLGRLLPVLPPPSAGSECEPAGGDGHTGHAGPVPPGPTSMAAVCADIAHEAVYAALADLLRHSRPHPRAACMTAHRVCSSPLPFPPASSSPRGLSSNASNHAESRPPAVGEPTGSGTSLGRAGGKPKRGLEKTDAEMRGEGPGEQDRRAGWAGAGIGMGEVERGMLLAVLERAWLGI